MTYKIFARTDQVSSSGCSIMFVLSPGKHKISTGHFCKKGSWDQRSQSVISVGLKRDPRATYLNVKLKKASILIQELIDQGLDGRSIRLEYQKQFAVEDVNIVLTSDIDNGEFNKLTPAGKEFYLLIEKIIHSHKSDWSNGYKRRFRSIRTKVLDYEPNFRVSMLTEEWWRGFVTYCIETRSNISNTINTDAKVLVALGDELGIDLDFDWEYIEPEVLPLSWEKVLKLSSVNLDDQPRATLKDSRKLWLAGAFTGRRWGEVENMGPHNFYQDRDGQWRYKNIGKGQKIVDIPLLPEAVAFLKSINFTLPKLSGKTVNVDIKTICGIAGFNEKRLVIKPVNADKAIKEIKEEWETVHFHTSRHSYAHRIVELARGEEFADRWVSFMLGHASYQTTWKYMNRSASSNDAMFQRIQQKITK